jgi:virulence factor
MIRLGIVDFHTSHCVEFSKRLHHKDIDKEFWVDGARVVAGWTGPSDITEPDRIESYRKGLLEDHGVELVANPEDLIGKVDGVLIQSQEGSLHSERAALFIKAGIPCFIDKPFTCSLSEARTLANLAKERAVPLFSTSSLRYAMEVQDLKRTETDLGRVLGAETYTPCSLHPKNPGLFHYGIHGVEILFALMGPGCRSVRTVWQERSDVTIGVWDDGRIGSVRGIRTGASGLGFTAFCEKGIVAKTIDTRYIYSELLKKIVSMFETGVAPLDISETIEIISFIEAAYMNQDKRGVEIGLK